MLDPGQIEQDVIANFVPSANALVVPTEAAKSRIHPGFPKNVPIVTASAAGTGRKLVNRDWDNAAPRLGFAWRPTASNTFVIRGGAGVFHTRIDTGLTSESFEQEIVRERKHKNKNAFFMIKGLLLFVIMFRFIIDDVKLHRDSPEKRSS
jgi:hypothetical protein